MMPELSSGGETIMMTEPAASDETVMMAESGPQNQSTPTSLSGRAAASGELQPGTVLGDRYEILQMLGIGGMGAVYRAKDRELDRLVALKVIRPDLANNPNIIERFKQELILARQVTHRNVIRVFDLDARISRLLLRALAYFDDAEAARRSAARERDRFFDSSVDLLCIADTEGRFLRLNPEWEKVLGRDRWVGMAWPEEYGGRGLDFASQIIFNEEYAKAGAPARQRVGKGVGDSTATSTAAATAAPSTAAAAATGIMMWLAAAPASARAFVVVLSWSHDPSVIRYL